MSTISRRIHAMPRLTGIAVVALCGAASAALAQTPRLAREPAPVTRELVRVREPVVVARPTVVAVAPSIQAMGLPVLRGAPSEQQVPQDVRIMQTIVSTALSAVEPPKLPSELADSTTGGAAGLLRLYRSVRRPAMFGGGDVSGFYMPGYGYLFTVRWPVGSTMPFFPTRVADLAEHDAVVAAAAGQKAAMASAKETLQQLQKEQRKLTDEDAKTIKEDAAKAAKEQEKLQHVQEDVQREVRRRTRVAYLGDQAQSKALAAWTHDYRQLLSNALRDAIAGYGSTLRRARPGESVTFIADFGGGDSSSVIMTVKAGALHGSNVAANRDAIHVSQGQSGMSPSLRTQLEIMSRIIDTSLHPDVGSDQVADAGTWSMYFGGEAQPQYVPGYGVIFRKNARMNTIRAFGKISGALWLGAQGTAVDSAQLAARKVYQAHLDTLRHKTAEILATYGPTLTDLGSDDRVGVYYDVGSAASLLDGGMQHYLVQARMRDIRQASTQSDPVAWLEGRLVTNENPKRK